MPLPMVPTIRPCHHYPSEVPPGNLGEDHTHAFASLTNQSVIYSRFLLMNLKKNTAKFLNFLSKPGLGGISAFDPSEESRIKP